jgi:hypothetical protein
MTIFWTIFLIVWYFAPAITAHQRGTRNRTQVLVLNTLLGWSVIGWIIALCMAYSPDIEVKK